jgi:hypothetical protein
MQRSVIFQGLHQPAALWERDFDFRVKIIKLLELTYLFLGALLQMLRARLLSSHSVGWEFARSVCQWTNSPTGCAFLVFGV